MALTSISGQTVWIADIGSAPPVLSVCQDVTLWSRWITNFIDNNSFTTEYLCMLEIYFYTYGHLGRTLRMESTSHITVYNLLYYKTNILQCKADTVPPKQTVYTCMISILHAYLDHYSVHNMKIRKAILPRFVLIHVLPSCHRSRFGSSYLISSHLISSHLTSHCLISCHFI